MGAFKVDPEKMSDDDVTIDYLLDNIWIVGSPDDVAAQLRRLSDEVGGFGREEREVLPLDLR